MPSAASHPKGVTLIETLTVLAIVLVLAAVALPNFKTHLGETRLIGAARVFKGHFVHAHSVALRLNVQTAMRFEERADGVYYSIYADGNHNGVLTRDIERGVDWRVRGPIRLDAGVAGVRVGILPGTPALPPDSGMLDTSDPIRFGRSNMVSFSPLGTATPGTFYLAGDSLQAAVRVTGGSARVRMMVCRGGRWTEK